MLLSVMISHTQGPTVPLYLQEYRPVIMPSQQPLFGSVLSSSHEVWLHFLDFASLSQYQFSLASLSSCSPSGTLGPAKSEWADHAVQVVWEPIREPNVSAVVSA